jgi:hypothetical protein
MPNSADLAAFTWLGLLLVVMVASPSLRGSLAGIARCLTEWKVLLSFLILAAWVVGEVSLGIRLSIWNSSFVTSTIIWYVVVAAWSLLSNTDLGEKDHYLTKLILAAFAPVVFVSVFLSLAPPNYIFELILQPVVAFLLASYFLAQHRSEAAARNLFAALLIGVFLVLVGSVAMSLFQDRHTENWGQVWREFALPVWLNAGVLPLIYMAGLVASYGQALATVKIFGGRSRAERFPLALALVWSFGLAGRQVTLFMQNASFEFARAGGFREALRVVKKYREVKSEVEEDDDAIPD